MSIVNLLGGETAALEGILHRSYGWNPVVIQNLLRAQISLKTVRNGSFPAMKLLQVYSDSSAGIIRYCLRVIRTQGTTEVCHFVNQEISIAECSGDQEMLSIKRLIIEQYYCV